MRRLVGNPLVILLVVAGTAALIVLPFTVGAGDADKPGPSPVAPVATSASSTEKDSLVVRDRQQADVNGDSRPDEVRLLGDPTEEMGEGAVEVTLADGTTGSALVPYGYAHFRPALDINRDGREQVLMTHSAGGDYAELLVYGWHDGELVRLQRDGDAPLGLEVLEGTRALDYYVDEGVLFSWLRHDRVDPDDWRRYHVETWSWSVEGDRLVGTPAGDGCINVMTSAPPGPCD